MKTKSRLLMALVFGLSSLHGCATTEKNRSSEVQPAEQAQVAEIAISSSSKEQAPPQSTAPVVKAVSPQAAAKASPIQPVTLLDRYIVVSGDTLATIAAKPEVYGDTQLWPLLYVANNTHIGPRGLIFPNQVLEINRNFTVDDVRALTGRGKDVTRRAIAVKPAENDKTAPVKTAKLEAKPAETAAAKPKEAAKPAAVEVKVETVAAAGTKEDAKPVAAKATTQDAAADKPKEVVKPSDFLGAARRAFAANDVPWAIYYYNSHLALKKKDADAWGELGNVYYLDGMLPESAQAYFNAANVLIDRGHTARALQLMPAIEEGNPGLAEAIYLRLTTVKR